MTESEFQIACLSDPRLSAHALSPMPAWLWSTDASRILWANPTAAAVFEAAAPGALGPRRFDTRHPAAAQIARLAGSLPPGGTARLERLRGFGASVGGTLICLCSRLTLARNEPAISGRLHRTRRSRSAVARAARRLIADMQRPAAVFSADGELIDATPAARERFGKAGDLIALGAEKLAKEASINGEAEARSASDA